MPIPTEPIGSIPRPLELIEAIATADGTDPSLDVALRYARRPVKQAVISPSALSLMYPADEIPGYPRERFIEDLLREHEAEVRRCLGFSPFCDDTTTTRDTAFAKIRARVLGTALAAEELGV